MDYKAGQTLWFKYTYGREEEVTITKVGRNWLHLSNRLRVDKDELIAEGKGYSSPGKCYLSKKDRDDEVALTREWGLLKQSISHHYLPPKHLSLEMVQQARKVLGLYSTESP